eukprot:16430382-Heterocapsa_arctica.AAC.1
MLLPVSSLATPPSFRRMCLGGASTRIAAARTRYCPAGAFATEIQALVDELQKRAAAGLHSVIWCVLPCTAWCSWQSLNLARGSGSTTQAIEEERLVSIKLLRMLMRLLCKVVKSSNSYTHACFEWPQNNFGWKLNIVRGLRDLQPYEACFDGCSYGLTDQFGELLRKPWRVISTLPEIGAALAKTCGHDHPHGQTHGISAKMSAYYTPAFANAVGNMLLRLIER